MTSHSLCNLFCKCYPSAFVNFGCCYTNRNIHIATLKLYYVSISANWVVLSDLFIFLQRNPHRLANPRSRQVYSSWVLRALPNPFENHYYFSWTWLSLPTFVHLSSSFIFFHLICSLSGLISFLFKNNIINTLLLFCLYLHYSNKPTLISTSQHEPAPL